MDWDAVAAIAEVVGLIVVVVSLVYLAAQIQQNTEASRAGTSFSINAALAEILDAIRSDGEFAGIWLRGCSSLQSLDEVERARFTSHLLAMLNLAEYIDQLEKQQLSDTHIDYIPWMALLYRDNPGIRSFMDSMSTVGSEELFKRLTDTDNVKGTNVYKASEAADG